MLDFDPDHWLAERRKASVAALPEKPLLQLAPATVATPATFAASRPPRFVANVANVAGVNRENENLRERATIGWQRALDRLDPHPPDGFSVAHWRTLRGDARWLLDTFGDSAARWGWSSADLFGLRVGEPHTGGVCDRLRGARSLVMTADRASWRAWGEVQRFNRGCCLDLRAFLEPGA